MGAQLQRVGVEDGSLITSDGKRKEKEKIASLPPGGFPVRSDNSWLLSMGSEKHLYLHSNFLFLMLKLSSVGFCYIRAENLS